jgi:FdhD protein
MSPDNQAIKKLDIFSSDGKTISTATALIIREVALTVKISGKTIAAIACSGNHIEELATGFLKSEGIITTQKDIEKIEVDNKKCWANIILRNEKNPSGSFVKNIASSGARSRNIDPASFQPLSVPASFIISSQLALKLMDDLLEKSVLHNKTHGTHCSALAKGGEIIALREDIGRHNTIDMLGGYALLNQIDLYDVIILTTGRISSEIVYKVWNLGIPLIISHSAPTTKAIELLNKAAITLIGYVRAGKMNIYSHGRRIKI